LEKTTLIPEYIRMTRINSKILHPQLSYELTEIFFKIHKELGRFCREKQYSNAIESLFRENNIQYQREYEIANSPKGNRLDFLVENLIIIDVKAKKFITKDDYSQMIRYLESAALELGIIVNFQSPYLKPKRVLNAKLKHSDNSGVNSYYSGRY